MTPLAAPPGLPRVLVVDDQPDIGRAVARALRSSAHVTVEDQPEVALKRLRHGERFDLVLCDVMMPGMTGPEFFDEVMACAPEMRAGFVFISGGMEGSVRRRLEATGQPCLEKPITTAALRGVLHRLAPRSD
jgi:two-component system NtrC family sensor kinase